MSVVFTAGSFFAFTSSRQAIYYPLFVLPEYNIPFAQITDEEGLIACFSEFPTSEGLDFHQVAVPYLAEVGDPFRIGFYDLDFIFWYGHPKVLWGQLGSGEISAGVAPLVRHQMSRMVGRKLLDSNSSWKPVVSRYLKGESDSRLYVSTELAIEYKISSIWNTINSEKPKPASIFNKDNQFSALSSDELFLWLARHAKDQRWPQAWLLMHKQTKGMDDRVWNMGLDYLFKNQSTDSPVSTLNQAMLVSLTSSIANLQSVSMHFVEYIRDLLLENPQFVEQNVLNDTEFRWMVRISLVGDRYAVEDVEYLSDVICKSRVSFSRLALFFEVLHNLMSKNSGIGSTDELNDFVHRSAYFDAFSDMPQYRDLAASVRILVEPVLRKRGRSSDII